MLENVNFTANQLAFIDWLAQPKINRVPTTQKQFADRMGVTEQTITRWRKLPGLKEAVVKRARELLSEDLPEIYGALRREAIAGSFQHLKLYLEITGEHTDKVDITWRQKLPVNRDPDEVINQFRELLYLAAKREPINKSGDN